MRHLDGQLHELLARVQKMGLIAESMVESAANIVVQRDAAMIRDLYAKEEEVNALQVEVDDQAVKLTVLHQPVAQDARFLFMASRIGGELERIADQAINVCQNAQHVGGEPAMKPMLDLPMMATLARRMV